MFRYTKYVMYLAPLGVGAAMAHTIGSKGIGVLLGLGKLVLTLYGTLLIFVFVVLGAVAMIARIPLRQFIQAVREPFILAFSTASSESALPLALENLELMGVPRAHRRVRSSHRLQLQPGRQHAVPFDGVGVRRAGGRRPHAVLAAAPHDADADADEQRSGRGAARVAGDPGRDAGHVRPSSWRA